MKDVKEAGADAALVLSPIGNTTADGMVKHYETLGTVGIPLVLYNHPAATGINIDMDMFNRLIAIPNVVGMKETSGSLPFLAEILRNYSTDDITLFTGCDDLTLPSCAIGLQAIILATANVDPRLPMIPATDEETARIEEALKIAGVK